MRRILFALCLLALLPLGGCQTLAERESTARLSVQVATIKVIEQSADISGADVIHHAEAAREVLKGDVTLAHLVESVRGRIGWERLDAADRLLLDAVLLEAEARLQARIGDGLIAEDARVTVVTLLDWIVQAARMTGGGTPLPRG